MKTIIKQKHDFQISCHRCKSIFQFDKFDIITYCNLGGDPYVICPVCNKWLNISNYEKINGIKELKNE